MAFSPPAAIQSLHLPPQQQAPAPAATANPAAPSATGALPAAAPSGTGGTGGDGVAVKVSHLPFDMSPREFRLIFTFSRHCVSADLNPATRTGVAVFASGDAAAEARDLLLRKSAMAASSFDDYTFAPVVEVQNLSAVLSSSGSSTTSSLPPVNAMNAINGHHRQSPPSGAFSALHISPPQRSGSNNFSDAKPALSSSTGKQFILGEENDSLQSVLSPTSDEFNFAEEQQLYETRPALNRRSSSQAPGFAYNGASHSAAASNPANPSNGLPPLNGFPNLHTSYPAPLMSSGLTSPTSPAGGGGLVNNLSNGYPAGSIRSSTPPMPMHHFSHHVYPRVLPAANPADQNPPCNTLYVGNLPMNTSEEELKALFSRQRGYRRLCFRTKSNGPMCFVEFEDVAHATRALTELYGRGLSNSVKGGIRLSFSKNPLGVRNAEMDRRASRPFPT